MPDMTNARVSPTRLRCNARAIHRSRICGRLQCAEDNAAIGSGVVGRRTFEDAAIGDPGPLQDPSWFGRQAMRRWARR